MSHWKAYAPVSDREIEIVQELLEQILQFETTIAASCDICAELDCLLSFADASSAYDYHRPELSEHNLSVIKQGRYVVIISSASPLLDTRRRHPLQELVVDTFVPNDTVLAGLDCPEEVVDLFRQQYDIDECMKGPKSGIIICTGANACGKVSELYVHEGGGA